LVVVLTAPLIGRARAHLRDPLGSILSPYDGTPAGAPAGDVSLPGEAPAHDEGGLSR